MQLYGGIWMYMMVYGGICGYMKVYECISGYMGSYGRIWSCLGRCVSGAFEVRTAAVAAGGAPGAVRLGRRRAS